MKPVKSFICILLLFPFITMAQSYNTSGSELVQTLRPDTVLLKEFSRNTINWMEAYNSKDGRNLIPLYSEDARYCSGHVPGLVAEGREAVVAYFQAGMNGGGHIDSIEILDAQVSCDLATLFCKYHATNSGVEAIGRNLLVMKKVNGKWLITWHMTVV